MSDHYCLCRIGDDICDICKVRLALNRAGIVLIVQPDITTVTVTPENVSSLVLEKNTTESYIN
jgi:hypothetical protein